MLNNGDSEQSADNIQTGEDKDNSQSFSPEQLKDLSSDQPEDFELSEAELGQISGGPSGGNWFKLKQDVPKYSYPQIRDGIGPGNYVPYLWVAVLSNLINWAATLNKEFYYA
jgi:hypothetical protein